MQLYKDEIYEIEIYKQARWLINKPNRQSGIVTFVKALLSPLFFVHDRFLRFRQAKLYQLHITTQVVYLEKLLNDRFDFTPRRIFIADAEWHLPWFVYLDEEEKPQYVFREDEEQVLWLYTDGESGSVKDDFVVHIPSELSFNENELRSYLDSYRLFGTRYKIERV